MTEREDHVLISLGITKEYVLKAGNYGLLQRWLVRTGRVKLEKGVANHMNIYHDGSCSSLKRPQPTMWMCDCKPNCVDPTGREWTWDHYMADPMREGPMN